MYVLMYFFVLVKIYESIQNKCVHNRDLENGTQRPKNIVHTELTLRRPSINDVSNWEGERGQKLVKIADG